MLIIVNISAVNRLIASKIKVLFTQYICVYCVYLLFIYKYKHMQYSHVYIYIHIIYIIYKYFENINNIFLI